jgi:hypothetical protein
MSRLRGSIRGQEGQTSSRNFGLVAKELAKSGTTENYSKGALFSWNPPISPLLYSMLLFLGMFIMLETGRRLGNQRRLQEAESDRGNLGTIEGAVFALFGLLMAFTFSGAASRFYEKRMLVADEANAIGTAYLRLDLVPDAKVDLQEVVSSLFGLTTRGLPQAAEYQNSKKIQQQIWSQAVTASRLSTSHPAAGCVLLPALNTMN